jgi:hypothetical protein
LADSGVIKTLPVTVSLGASPQEVPLVYNGDNGYLAVGLAFVHPSLSNSWRLVASRSNAPRIGCFEGVGLGASKWRLRRRLRAV